MSDSIVQIALYSDEHRDGVIDVVLPIQREEFEIPITLEDQPDLLSIPTFYQKGNGNFWVALSGDTVVGTIALLDIGNREVGLRKMFVAAPFRGREQGVAARLLSGALDWAKQQGVERVFLGTTAKYLAAHRFYEKNGFIEITREELPVAFPIMTVDTKFYRRDLL